MKLILTTILFVLILPLVLAENSTNSTGFDNETLNITINNTGNETGDNNSSNNQTNNETIDFPPTNITINDTNVTTNETGNNTDNETNTTVIIPSPFVNVTLLSPENMYSTELAQITLSALIESNYALTKMTIHATGPINKSWTYRYDGGLNDENTTFLVNFENGLLSEEGENAISNGTEIVEGKFGNGVLIDGLDTLSYKTNNNFDPNVGTIEFWIKPLEDWNELWNEQSAVQDSQENYFVPIKLLFNSAGNDSFEWYFDPTTQELVWSESSSTARMFSNLDSNEWEANTWYHLALTWDFNTSQFAMYRNGVLIGYTNQTLQAPNVGGLFYIGHYNNEMYQVNSVIDNFKISNVAKTQEQIQDAYEGITVFEAEEQMLMHPLPLGDYEWYAEGSNIKENFSMTETRSFKVITTEGSYCAILRGFLIASYGGDYNNASDINDDGIVDLKDIGIFAIYDAEGDEEWCYKQLGIDNINNLPEGAYCTAIIEGIKETYGFTNIDEGFNKAFDLNDDGVIDLSDVGLVVAYSNGDTSKCKERFVTPEPPTPTPEPPRRSGGGGGRYIPPEEVVEEVVEPLYEVRPPQERSEEKQGSDTPEEKTTIQSEEETTTPTSNSNNQITGAVTGGQGSKAGWWVLLGLLILVGLIIGGVKFKNR